MLTHNASEAYVKVHMSVPESAFRHRWYQKYGAFYADVLQDALLAERLLTISGLARIQTDLILEGGSVNVDGEG